MKPVLRLAAAGFSSPIPVDYRSVPMGIGLVGIPSSNANLTWGVQHTLDDAGPEGVQPVTYTQAATTITVTDLRSIGGTTGHGLSVADSVYLRGIAGTPDGPYQVATVTSQTIYTVTSLVNQAAAGGATASNFRWLNHVSMTGQTGRLDGNYAYPIRAVRLAVSPYVTGYVDLLILQGWI